MTRWTWNPERHPGTARLLDSLQSHVDIHDWPHAIENDASDAIIGKVLAVVAGIGIASTTHLSRQAQEAIAVVNGWVDSPTEEAFHRVCAIHDDPSLRMPAYVARIAMSSVGNYEAGHFLGTVVIKAREAGLSEKAIIEAVLSALDRRRTRSTV